MSDEKALKLGRKLVKAELKLETAEVVYDLLAEKAVERNVTVDKHCDDCYRVSSDGSFVGFVQAVNGKWVAE